MVICLCPYSWYVDVAALNACGYKKLNGKIIKSPALQWRHNGYDSVWNHQPHDCLLNHLFRRRSKKISKLRVTGLCAKNSPKTGEFPAQMASNAENVSIWWRHHANSRTNKLRVWGLEQKSPKADTFCVIYLSVELFKYFFLFLWFLKNLHVMWLMDSFSMKFSSFHNRNSDYVYHITIFSL